MTARRLDTHGRVIVSRAEAFEAGYCIAVTEGYSAAEQPLFDTVISDLERGTVAFVLVDEGRQGVAVYRKPAFHAEPQPRRLGWNDDSDRHTARRTPRHTAP
jgi:hypothetical protein